MSMDQLINGLRENAIEYEYDSNRNYLIITSNKYAIVNKILEESDIFKDYGYYTNPNDCVLWRASSPPNVPPGAMM